MKHTTKQTGARGEDTAIRYLKKKGYTIVSRNYRCLFGEIDIVARDSDEIVFVEVKSRRSKGFGYPEEAVDFKKQRKISKVALNYLNEHHLSDQSARFDVVAISLLPEGNAVKLIKNAFDLIA